MPKDFFDDFQRWDDGLQRGIKISVLAFWQGEIFYLKVVKYLDESKSLKKHSRLFAFVDWQAANEIDWNLRRILNKDVKICVQNIRVIGYIPS